jgi:PAS domain S-box-containing protein
MSNETAKAIDTNAFKFLTLATFLTLVTNAFIIVFLGTYHNMIFGAIQCLWTIAGIFLLWRISSTTTDKTLKDLSLIFGIALVPWTITLMLWKILLPAFYYNDMAYYVTGFGFLVTYGILFYALGNINRSDRWHTDPAKNRMISVLWALAVAIVLLIVLFNLKWDSNKLVDITILVLYLLGDLTILAFCLKLAYRNLGADIKYLVLVIGEFIAINLVADFLFELRWLLPVSHLFSYKISFVINIVYNVSLVFMVMALLLYVSKNRERALNKINESLSNTKIFVNDIIRNSPDAMCIYDLNGNAVIVNDQYLRLFETEKSRVIGMANLFEQLGRMDPRANPDVIDLKSGGTINVQRTIVNQGDGKSAPRYITIKAYPTLDVNGAISNYAAIFEDMTEKVKTEEELLESRSRAELYLDLMSHDINNLHQIAIGYLELAGEALEIETGDRDLIVKPLEVLHRSANLIENVRKLQRVQKGEITNEVIDLNDVLMRVIGEYRPVYGGEIAYNNGKGLHRVLANELLYDVFANLVGNAIKHSNGGSANISIIVDPAGSGNKTFYRVSVEDSGPGIPDDMKVKIFNRLQRGETRAKGMGLGLFLVKSLVDSYHGRVWVEDRVSGDHRKGSRFVVMLPSI